MSEKCTVFRDTSSETYTAEKVIPEEASLSADIWWNWLLEKNAAKGSTEWNLVLTFFWLHSSKRSLKYCLKGQQRSRREAVNLLDHTDAK